ncbi:MAG: FAD-dependent oxidoreductase, partial [Myxococcales bacterium]|nr:FAD-dependent oxidoreductase [Myxococcales bacterium]
MFRRLVCTLALRPALGCIAHVEGPLDETDQREAEQVADPSRCKVVIAGGTTAALAAALAAAAEGSDTCLLEPTDWVGGQLTAS